MFKKFSNLSFVNKVLLGLIIILIIALIITLYWPKISGKQHYSAVYLTSGDLYFGKISWFPRLTISNVYLLQKNPNDQQNPYSLSRFGNAFWGPTDEISLNRETVLWMAPLRDDSQVVKYIQSQEAQK